MNRDDVIRMAREAGSIDSEDVIETVFAAFTAAEREAICKLGEDSRYSHQYVHSFLNTIRARGQA